MKETLNGVISHSDGYYNESDPLSINTKNLQHFKLIGKETDNSVLLKREDGCWTGSERKHSEFVNHFIKDMESAGKVSPNKNDLGEILNRKPGTKDSKMLASVKVDSYELLNGPEFERVMAPDDCANYDEREMSDSGAQSFTSKSFQAESTLYTDKNVMECDVPQLVVCCKDIDCQHVKDICVDKGGSLEEKGPIDKHTDNFVGPHVSMPSIGYGTNETTGNPDHEFPIPDKLPSIAQVDSSDLTVSSCDAKEESKIISTVLSESECLPEGKVKENGRNSEGFVQTSERIIGNKIEKCVVLVDEPLEPMTADSRDTSDAISEKPSNAEDLPNHNYWNFTDPLNSHVVQYADKDEREGYVLDSKYRNSNNPFLTSEIQSSCKDRSNMDTHLETLLTDMEGHSNNPVEVDVQTVEASTEAVLPRTIVNHKNENFNPFISSESETPITGKDTESFYQVPVESPKRRSTNNPFADSEVENADMDKNFEAVDQQPELSNYKIADTNNPFSVGDIHSSSKVKGIQNSDEQNDLNPKGNSYNPFTDPEDEGAIIGKTAGKAGTVSFTYQGGAGIGETSFSAVSGRITYSGPITFSGNTSLRSDSSTTSTRSFAFPVLQSEWNSSPVRMERAGRRKQRGGWKHSILCCKF